jgi:hypothetical protein
MSRKVSPLVLGRFVPEVDASAVGDSWTMAARIKKEAAGDICVFVMGPTLAPAHDLAAVIADQRRRTPAGGGRLFITPVNTRTWVAHVPNDAPQVVKALLARLRST